MWRGVTAFVALAGLVLAGSARAHLVAGDPVHIDIGMDPYVVGEPLTTRLYLSNPGPDPVSFVFSSSCALDASVTSERRILLSLPHDRPCMQVAGGETTVPAKSSILWREGTFETRPDDGCIVIDVALHVYHVSGHAQTCPGPAPTPSHSIALSVSAPTCVRSGEALGIQVIVRTLDGMALEGIRIDGTLGDEELGSVSTGPEGTASLLAWAPDVDSKTVLPLTIHASGKGWRANTASRTVTVFPSTAQFLALRPNLLTGDIMGSEGLAVLKVSVRGSDTLPVTDVSLAVEAEFPLTLDEVRDAGGNRFYLILKAGAVGESRVVSLRVVAIAPGFERTELVLDYHILAPSPSLDDGGELRDTSVTWQLAVVVGLLTGAAAVFLATSWRRLRAHRDR